MDKGYKFGTSICPDCGEEVADNWYVRHRKKKHPVPSAICDDPGIMNHFGAVGFFNRLIIDLKLRELGEEHDPITMERLEEASAHVRDIAACTRRVRVRRAQGGEWLRTSGTDLEYEVNHESRP